MAAESQVQDIRNIAFCGHGSAGKTTLVDTLLTTTGAVKRPASVDDGTSICDFDEEEKHHKYTIESTLVHFDHAGKHFNVHRHAGLSRLHRPDDRRPARRRHGRHRHQRPRRASTSTPAACFNEAGKRGLGRMIVINKMDADNIDFPALLGQHSGAVRQGLHSASTCRIGHGARLQRRGQHAASAGRRGRRADRPGRHPRVADRVDHRGRRRRRPSATSKARRPPTKKLARLIVEAVAAGSLIPIVCVSAKTGVGLPELLDALAAVRAAARQACRARQERGRRGSDDQGRSGRAAGGPGLQDAHRSVRAEAELHPHLLRHAQEGRQRARLRRAQGRQAASTARRCRPAKRTRSTRPRRATSWPWPRSKSCTPACRWATWSCRRSSFPRRWSAWP